MENIDIKRLSDLLKSVQKGGDESKSAAESILSSVKDQAARMNSLSISLNENETKLAEALKKMSEMSSRIKYLEELLNLRNYEAFMKKREQDRKTGQMTLFDMFDDLEANQRMVQIEGEIKAEGEKLAVTPEPKKKRSKSLVNDPVRLPDNLPVIIKDIKFDDEDVKKGGLKDIHSDIVRKYLHKIPSRYEIVEEHVHQYRKGSGADSEIVRPRDEFDRFVGKSPLDSSVVADIMVQKYLMGTPLYRQEALMRNEGIFLSRATMVNSLSRALPAILPVAEQIKAYILSSGVIHADETPDPVIRLEEKGSGKDPVEKPTKTYVWGFGTSGRGFHPSVYYQLGPSRSKDVPEKFLSGCGKGTVLQTDGYSPYHTLPGITNAGCMAHVRRKFFAAAETGRNDYRSQAEGCVRIIDLMYAKDRVIRDACGDDFNAIKERRNSELPKLFASLDSYIDSFAAKIEKSSTLSRAVAYYQGQKEYLLNILKDGRTDLDNNFMEREGMKPFVTGRKNWLFSFSSDGARTSCAIYSLVQTARLNGVRIFDYLQYLLDSLPYMKTEGFDYGAFLPWSESLPKRLLAKVPTPSKDPDDVGEVKKEEKGVA